MTDEEMIEQAAIQFSTFRVDKTIIGLNKIALDQYVGFKAGVQYRDQNPSAEVQALVEALRSAIAEARDQLDMYIRAYKKEPYDTGVLLHLYIKETEQRLQRYAAVLEAWVEK